MFLVLSGNNDVLSTEAENRKQSHSSASNLKNRRCEHCYLTGLDANQLSLAQSSNSDCSLTDFG